MTIQPGIYEMSNHDYHAGPGLSCSLFKEFLRSPAHYQYYLTEKREPTPAMAVGTALHTAILEPDKFEQEIAVAPDCDKRTKAGKEEHASFLEASQGKTVITAKDHKNILGMAESVKRCEAAVNLLSSPGFAELSVFAEDPEYGFLWKARPDWLTPASAIIDLKKCQDASPEGFQRQIGNYQYHLQAALYLQVLTWATGKKHEHFYFVAVEEKPPHGCAVYSLDFRSLDAARVRINSARSRFAECLETDEWPGYSGEIQVTGVPRWAL